MSNLNPIPQRTSLPQLQFDDQDLTDPFNDEHDGSHSSRSGLPHPRGSTPLSIISSRPSTSSQSLSRDSPNGRKALPNISALLDFLDHDQPLPSFNSNSQAPLLSKSQTHSNHLTTPGPSQTTRPSPPLHHHLTSPASAQSQASPHSDASQHRTREATSPLYSPNVPQPNPSHPSTHQHRLGSSQASSSRHGSSHSNTSTPHPSPSVIRKETQDRHQSRTSSREAYKPTSKVPSAADRMAAAVMEGAPDVHWTLSAERVQVGIHPTIRRSKVVEELLQPIQPSLSAHRTVNHANQDLLTSLDDDDDDLPHSLIEETRGTRLGGTAFNRLTSDFITPARALGPSGKRAELIKQSSERDRGVDDTDPQNVDHKLRSERQDDSLDHRVTQLLGHIRADQIEKNHLTIALAEARAEVSSLRDEVRLLRIGVQKLTDEQRPYHHSADARLERPPALGHPSLSSSKHHQLEGELEALLSSKVPQAGPSTARLNSIIKTQFKSTSLPNLSKEKKKDGQLNHNHQEEEEEEEEDSPIKADAKKVLIDLALALSFTRSVDDLIHDLRNPLMMGTRRRKRRDDQEIFQLDHLDDLLSRLRLWKHLARRTGPLT